MDGIYYFIDLMQKGKAVNYVILMLYLITLAAAAERAVYYTLTRYKRNGLVSLLKLLSIAHTSKSPLSKELFNQKNVKNSWIPDLANVFFEYRTADRAILEEAFERAVQQIIAAQERGFILLSRIAAVAPLLGLLGTVTGLMAAFQKIASLGGNVDITVLSGGIWEAMITTATGLVTAICAFTLYEIFDWLNMRRVRDMEQFVSVLTEQYISSNAAADCITENTLQGTPDETL
ncbi:MAG: MotA/TolQ/ExbB proton channel family protein [Treponema sp.]